MSIHVSYQVDFKINKVIRQRYKHYIAGNESNNGLILKIYKSPHKAYQLISTLFKKYGEEMIRFTQDEHYVYF